MADGTIEHDLIVGTKAQNGSVSLIWVLRTSSSLLSFCPAPDFVDRFRPAPKRPQK
jgi:hypothetical protein